MLPKILLTFSDIELSSSSNTDSIISRDAVLRLLSVVEVDRIPTYLVLGASFQVKTTNPKTEAWFRNYLLALGDGTEAELKSHWWQTARPNSSLGILVSVNYEVPSNFSRYPRTTELLFYADRASTACDKQSTPPNIPQVANENKEKLSTITVHALALSSDLLCRNREVTPPSSSGVTNPDDDAVFLPPSTPTASELINEPPVRKRKSASDAFDEATERRKVRRKGAADVAAAAVTKNEHVLSCLKHRRSVSGSGSQAVPIQTRPLSRASSSASSRPITARPPSEAPKHNLPPRAQSMSEPDKLDSIESKNKEVISRIVMAGMRLYGLTQSKSRKSRSSSSVASPALDASFERREIERQMDEEYKLVYHSVFKGTCFALRRHISILNLQPHLETLREIADSLLRVYCADPLTANSNGLAGNLSEGGRKTLGSAVRSDAELEHNFSTSLEAG